MKTPFKKNQPPGAFGGLDIPLIQPRVATATFSAMAGAPHELVKAYHDELEKHLNLGKEQDEAHKRAIRHTQNMGWMKTTKGWKQILPDIRDKVKVAEAVKQLDGTYLIEGVPVFYPNAVKGKELPFSADDIKQFMQNTNECNAKPTIIEGHPNEMLAAMGKQQDAHGFATNFRDYEKNKGHAQCDLYGVDHDFVKRLQERKLPYLSLGFARDKHGNRRVGHVAYLGGASPALSFLPPTDYFSVSGNYLCFSADSENIFPKGKPMFSTKARECFAAMKGAEEACYAAEKAKELDQPDADARMAEAEKGFKAAKMNFDAAMTNDEMPPTAPGEGALAPMPMDPDAAGTDTSGAYAAEVRPAVTPMGSQTAQFATAEDFHAYLHSPNVDPTTCFSALVDDLFATKSQLKTVLEVAEALRIKDRANVNRARFVNFQAECANLRRTGRVLPDDGLLKEEFESFFESRDPDKAMTLSIKRYKALPPQQTPATALGRERFFDASSADSARPKVNGGKVTRSEMQGVMARVSEDDMKFAALGEAVEAQ